MAANTIREPPSYAGIKGDRKKLTHYISALKTWARVSGVEKKNQADTVKYHAYQTAPKLFEENSLVNFNNVETIKYTK